MQPSEFRNSSENSVFIDTETNKTYTKQQLREIHSDHLADVEDRCNGAMLAVIQEMKGFFDKYEKQTSDEFQNPDGSAHDARCSNAQSKDCTCKCGGKFHGRHSGIKAEFGKDAHGNSIARIEPNDDGLKTYHGRYVGECEWLVTVSNGKETFGLNPRNDICNHSPSGFAWGYGGSGPAQLALALVSDVLLDHDIDPEKEAYKYYQSFKWDKIASIPQEQEWEMNNEEIWQWIQEQKKS